VATILNFIRPNASAFDEFAIRAMGQAFDTACAELQDDNPSKLVREVIAERIIDAAKRRERNPQRLGSRAVAGISGDQTPDKPPQV
jgi:hypothetical protein